VAQGCGVRVRIRVRVLDEVWDGIGGWVQENVGTVRVRVQGGGKLGRGIH